MSHKIFRLLVPFALLAMLVSGLLVGSGISHVSMPTQWLILSISVAALLAPVVQRDRVMNLAYFFLVMNVAALAGFWKWFTGHAVGSW